MDRRQFLQAGAVIGSGALLPHGRADETPGFASPKEAMKGPREKHLFVVCTYAETGVNKPDYLAVVDADPASKTYSKVVHRLSMPEVGDELHHFGWNICSSCHGRPGDRRYLIVPGLGSSRIHVVDAKDPLNLKLHKVINPEQVKAAGFTAPHTVHCLPSGEIMLSMLGDANGDAPGGFLLLDDKFDIKGRWEKNADGMRFNYDFWYQPRHNVMVSSEWAAPNTYRKGFDPNDVAAGKYGKRLHVWDWKDRRVMHSVELKDGGDIPLEVRFLHDPDSPHGFTGAALGSAIWHVRAVSGEDVRGTVVGKVVQVEPVKAGGQDVPGLITDILVSMDDRFLYFSNWLHGDVRQYAITDPKNPRLVGQLFLGGVIGKARELHGEKLLGGPQMLQLSLDGKRLYVTNSLLGKWDNQFHPGLAKRGSWMLQLDCDTDKGGLALNERFFVDFGKEPDGPSRAHEVRYPGGDCTSDIFT
ncbi:MAG: selenium-binding family protein [Gemmataceae bacterium]|nr:selenium-binding family protein [Gemmataceae bacterium]